MAGDGELNLGIFEAGGWSLRASNRQEQLDVSGQAEVGEEIRERARRGQRSEEGAWRGRGKKG